MSRRRAEKKLASRIVDLQSGLFDLKTLEIRKLGYQMSQRCKVKERFSHSKEEVAKQSWFLMFLAMNPEIKEFGVSNIPLSKKHALKKMNEHFDVLENICIKYKINASRIYNVEFYQFSGKIAFVYCTSASGLYINPMIILNESEEADVLLKKSESFNGCYIMKSPTGTLTNQLFGTWLRIFIANVDTDINEKIILYINQFNTKCKYFISLEVAHDNGIILLQVPCFGPIKMQPLIMTLVKRMHCLYIKEFKEWILKNSGMSLTLEQLLQTLLKVYNEAAMTENAVKGFRNAGIWPLNKNSFQNALVGTENYSEMESKYLFILI